MKSSKAFQNYIVVYFDYNLFIVLFNYKLQNYINTMYLKYRITTTVSYIGLSLMIINEHNIHIFTIYNMIIKHPNIMDI